MAVRSADDIDPAWLERVLAGAGFDGVWIDDLRVETIAQGAGLLATVARVTAVHQHDRAPRSLIVKLPADDARTRSIADQFGYYRREAGAYQHLLHDCDRSELRTPLCYGVVDEALGPVLVLEDLPHAPGDQLQGATREQALSAATLLATIHSRFWNREDLDRYDWLPGPNDEAIAGYRRLFDLTWPMFVNRFGHDIPREQLGAAERAITRFDDVIARFAAAPTTLVHGDFRLDNLLFSPSEFDPDAPDAHVIDWQLAARGRGPYDLAFFMAGSMGANQRRIHERAVVERYHGYLQLGGVIDYSLEECFADYYRGHIMNLPNPITAAVAVPPGNDRGRELLIVNARRALAALADYDRRGLWS